MRKELIKVREDENEGEWYEIKNEKILKRSKGSKEGGDEGETGRGYERERGGREKRRMNLE